MIPSALRTEKKEADTVGIETGSYVMVGGRFWLTESTHTMVQYVIAVTAPTSESPAMELRFGSWDNTMHRDVNTRYHSTVVRGFEEHSGPHTVWKNNFMVSPPTRIRAVAVPAER